jgi:HAMP domain-containing protein
VNGTDRARGGFGLTLKIFTATALVVVVALGATLALAGLLARRSAETELDQRLANTSEVARFFIEAENAKLASGAATAAQEPNFVAAITKDDPSSRGDLARSFAELLGASYALITDPHGVLLGRSDRPDARGDSLGDSPLVGGALESHEQVAGFVNQGDQKLFLAVATPIITNGALNGVLLATHQVTDSLADRVKRGTGSDIVFYVLGEGGRPIVMASSVPRGSALEGAVATTVRGSMAGGRTEMRAEATVNGRSLVGFNRTLVNPGRDTPMGGYLALRSLDDEMAGFKQLQSLLIWLAVGAVLLALGAAGLVAKQIGRPVKALAAVANRVAEGDYDTPVTVTSKDEIGQLAAALSHMVDELKAKQQLVDFLGGSAASSAATQPIYTAGGAVASPTLVRSMAANTGMLAVGQTFAGRYDVKSVLGMGGMGVVYRAVDKELGETVAIKTLKGDAMAADPALLARFKDEIRLARKITHRNVVRTHDLGEVEGMYYITMEFCEGQSLKHLIQSRGHLPVNVTLTLGKQLCRALEVAHEQGVIHRDIKPQNLIVEPTGTLKVMDFGIARLATRSEGFTQAGTAIGTPEYMAPEQLLGNEVDFRADLYAAGCVLFECLTGRTPFVADSPITLVAKQLEETPPSPATLNGEVPEALAQLILRTLSKDPGLRPQSAAELHDALDALGATSAAA